MNNLLNEAVGLKMWVGFSGTFWNDELKDLIKSYRIGGIVLFKRNILNKDQLKALIEDIISYSKEILKRPVFIAVDQEGGTVRRLQFVDIPPPRELKSDMEVSKASSETAKALKELGINVNLAPVLDRVEDPSNHFMTTRAFDSDPSKVSEFGSLWINIHKKYGVLSVAKHFPGLSSAKEDPHFHRLTIHWENPLEMRKDLAPFESAIREGVFGIMVSHGLYPLWDPNWPGPLSRVICTEWLKKRLSFKGLVVSDDLDMKAIKEVFSPQDIAKQSTLAGVDCLLICNDPIHRENIYRALLELANSDSYFKEAVLGSAEKIEKILLST